ncbi:MAG TPA: hypothetical protein VK171_13270, partial [Fimbriimonas sp.]|nr:hypothetical protein [Fimbriimonas sp.]
MSDPAPKEIDREQLRLAGWRQGSVIRRATASPQLLEALKPTDDQTHWLVISQDCDLLQSQVAKEPWVECLACTEIATPDGNFQQGKNPRRHDFPISQDEKLAWLRASIHDRCRFPREKLIGTKPNAECLLSSGACRTITGWVARRYTRSAFPDEFNRRTDTKATRDK